MKEENLIRALRSFQTIDSAGFQIYLKFEISLRVLSFDVHDECHQKDKLSECVKEATMMACLSNVQDLELYSS